MAGHQHALLTLALLLGGSIAGAILTVEATTPKVQLIATLEQPAGLVYDPKTQYLMLVFEQRVPLQVFTPIVSYEIQIKKRQVKHENEPPIYARGLRNNVLASEASHYAQSLVVNWKPEGVEIIEAGGSISFVPASTFAGRAAFQPQPDLHSVQ
jgi:hypothetical protein